MNSLFDLVESPVVTVGQLTARIQQTLEQNFGQVFVVGEISSLSRPGSGHLYFNLKDSNALIRGVVWRTTARKLKFELEDGLEVVGRGRLAVYAPRGDYQLILDDVTPKGLGRQDLALRKLKEKLAKLGYFASERKKPLPRFPRRIALVTSPRAAAVRDMLEILGRRWPIADIVVCPVRVQGEEAAVEIARMLSILGKIPGIDIILLGRGGGSSDDLAAFNHERVAHALFQCPIPVVSAVGHEIDITIADLVADRRALTPSEAAEIATPDRGELMKSLRQQANRLSELLQSRVRSARQRLDDVQSRRVFRQPLDRNRELERRLDGYEQRLRLAGKARITVAGQKIAAAAAQLQSLSPLNVLARGYSLTRTEAGLLRSVEQANVGDRVEIVLADGQLNATINEVVEIGERSGIK